MNFSNVFVYICEVVLDALAKIVRFGAQFVVAQGLQLFKFGIGLLYQWQIVLDVALLLRTEYFGKNSKHVFLFVLKQMLPEKSEILPPANEPYTGGCKDNKFAGTFQG